MSSGKVVAALQLPTVSVESDHLQAKRIALTQFMWLHYAIAILGYEITDHLPRGRSYYTQIAAGVVALGKLRPRSKRELIEVGCPKWLNPRSLFLLSWRATDE